MYPKMVYKCPGDNLLPGNKSFKHEVVYSDEEADTAVTQGWFPTLPEALAGKLDEPVVSEGGDKAPTRKELETKAKELGLKFDKKTTDVELGEAIAAKLAA